MGFVKVRLKRFFADCEAVPTSGNEPMLGLSKLILGCCYCIQRQYPKGIENFKLCLELRKDLPSNAVDAHISAFSHYELGALMIKTNEVGELVGLIVTNFGF